MAYFPFVIDIENKNCLVVGGGTIALHKIQILSEFEVFIHVVSLEICKELDEFAADHEKIEIEKREFRDNDIQNIDFVIAATDDKMLNLHIANLCKKNNILVNAVDMREACSFIFPALIKKDDMIVSVSSGGKSPIAAAYMKKKIENDIPDFYGTMIDTLGQYRTYIMQRVKQQKRKEIFSHLLQYGMEHHGEITAEIVDKIIESVGQD